MWSEAFVGATYKFCMLNFLKARLGQSRSCCEAGVKLNVSRLHVLTAVGFGAPAQVNQDSRVKDCWPERSKLMPVCRKPA